MGYWFVNTPPMDGINLRWYRGDNGMSGRIMGMIGDIQPNRWIMVRYNLVGE